MTTNKRREEDEDLLDRKFEISLRNAYRSIAGVIFGAVTVLGVYYSFKNDIILLNEKVKALEKRIELLEDKK